MLRAIALARDAEAYRSLLAPAPGEVLEPTSYSSIHDLLEETPGQQAARPAKQVGAPRAGRIRGVPGVAGGASSVPTPANLAVGDLIFPPEMIERI